MIEQGYTKDQIYQEDLNRGLSGPNSLSSTYGLFYGSDAIAVEYDSNTGRYNVINGNHRLFAAKQLGIVSLPVKII